MVVDAFDRVTPADAQTVLTGTFVSFDRIILLPA